ncbi:hypothetical protein D3C87_1750030 [compost metagenome]
MYVRVVEDEAQCEFGHRHACRDIGAQCFGSVHAGIQVLGHEIGRAPVVGRECGFLGERAGERTFVEWHTGDHADVHFPAKGEQIILRRLVENVVNYLYGVNQAGFQCF